MSSKASSDPMLSTSNKKDKDKKESKKEKKERKEREKKEKKEKKEKSKKREKTNDVGDENQESPSAKKKKRSGIFRLKGKKTKRSSLGSLKQEGGNSSDFDRSGSEFSFQDPSGSMETALAENAEPSEKIVLDIKKGSAKATLAVLAESSDVVQPDLTNHKGIDKTGAEIADGSDPIPKEDSVRDELQKMEEPANIQEQNTSVEKMQVDSLELKPRSIIQVSAIIPEPNEDMDDSSTKREKEEQNGSVTLTLQEAVSSRAEEVSHVSQVALEDMKKVHDLESTSSGDESVDTVVSTGISDSGDVTGRMRDELESGLINQGAVENSVNSTYRKRSVLLQDDSQDGKVQNGTPMNAETMLLVYADKQQVQEQNARQDDPVNDEIPMEVAVNQNQEIGMPMLEEDASSSSIEKSKRVESSESAHDNEVALEDIKTVRDREITDNDEFWEPLEQEDTAAPIISTHKERKVPSQDDQQAQEEASLNEEKQHVQDQHGRENNLAEEEKPEVLAVVENLEGQHQEQDNEFLNHDAVIKEKPKHEGENHAEPIVHPEEEKKKPRSAISLCCFCLGY